MVMRGYCFNDCCPREDCGLGMNELRVLSFTKISPSASHISSHGKKKVLSPFYQLKIFLIENECEIPIGCLTLIFSSNVFLRLNELEAFFIFL